MMTALWTHRRTHALLLVLTLVTVSVCGCKKKAEEAPEVSVTVQAAPPTVGPISEEIAADAVLAPVAAAAISPRINAPIRAEYVQRGAHVRRGQLLVSLDDRDLKGSALDSTGAVTSARANLTATTLSTIPEALKKAQLDMAQLKAALDVAARTAQERQTLFKQGALSGREADAAYAAEVQAQAAYDAARQHAALLEQTTRVTNTQAAQGQLTSAEGKLESAQAQVSFARLRSPIDGVVTERPLFPGETTAAGTPVITVMDTSSLLAKLHLAQAAAQKLSIGHPAKVTVPGLEEAGKRDGFIHQSSARLWINHGRGVVEIAERGRTAQSRNPGACRDGRCNGTTCSSGATWGDRTGGRWKHERRDRYSRWYDKKAGCKGGYPNCGCGSNPFRIIGWRHRGYCRRLWTG